MLLVAALATVIAWRFNYEILPTAAGVVIFAVLAEIFFFHTRLMLVTLISLAQVCVVVISSFIIYTVMSKYTTIYGMSLVMGLGMALIGFLAIILAIIGNYFFAQGRLWVNTLVSFLVYNAISVPLIASGIELSYIIQSLIALGGMIIYIVARHYLPLSNITSFNIESIKTQKSSSAVKAKIQKEHPNLKIQEINKRIFLASNDKVAFVILPITPTKYFTIMKNDVFLDGETITGVLEHVLSESKSISYSTKVNKKFFIPVIYVTTKSTLKSKLTTIKVRSRVTPERVMGNVFITTPSGFESLLTGYEKHKLLPSKLREKLESLSV
jgi:hypothetical protein